MDAAETALKEVRNFLKQRSNVDRLEKIISCSFNQTDVRPYAAKLP